MAILFMKGVKDARAKEDETVTTEEEYLDARNLQKIKQMMGNLSEECNPCISLLGGCGRGLTNLEWDCRRSM